MVKEHVRTLMGQATLAYDSAIVRMPKLQAVQVRLPDTHAFHSSHTDECNGHEGFSCRCM